MMGVKGKVLAQLGKPSPSHCVPLQTLEAVKRKQFEKFHAASSEEQATIERNPYTIFHQALKNCEPVIGLAPILKGGRFYQVTRCGRDKMWGGVLAGGRDQSWIKMNSFLGARDYWDLIM